LQIYIGFEHDVGHPEASVWGKSTSALEERGFRGLRLFTRLADTVIETFISIRKIK